MLPKNQLGKPFGLPCWDPNNVSKAISGAGLALLEDEAIPYFLATHAPFTALTDDINRVPFNAEEEVFQEVLIKSRAEVLCVVHGAPGTGKSHLVHWLQLRTEDAIARGEIKKLRPVLIRRGAGTLKSTLEQMIVQLGDEFAHHLQPVREALSRLNDTAARRKLLLTLSQELGDLREERKKPPLSRSLASLPQALRGEGFNRWLTRAGGAIDLNIRRLTEAASLDGPGGVAEFSAAHLNLPLEERNTRDMDGATIDLLDELDDDADRNPGAPLRAEAAREMNDSLRVAIQELTGLSGNRLFNTFAEIRRELKKKRETLALFIEDVSAAGELDEEIIKVVEPEPYADQCRLIAVLGMTTSGYEKLRGNTKQRVTHPVSVGSSGGGWRDDSEGVAEFSARYLNAIRLDEAAVRSMAVARRSGGDINRSACENCDAVKACHAAFGQVTINGHQVGLFPFTPEAPKRLLNGLIGADAGALQTPRGLLQRLIGPILDDKSELFEKHEFPSPRLPVAMAGFGLSKWSAFVRQYCGTWSDENKRRLQLLSAFWIAADDEHEAAAKLLPFLEPLAFPKFGRHVEATSIPEGPVIKPIAQTPAIAKESPKLNQFLARLDKWYSGGTEGRFQRDDEPRDMIASLIRNGISWDDERIPKTLWDNLIAGDKKEFVYIEGQISEPRNALFAVRLDRSKETRDLLDALAKFQYEGARAWSYANGQSDKRSAAVWLRKRSPRIVADLKAAGELEAGAPAQSAVRFLAAAAIVRRRAKLPEKREEMIKELLADTWADADEPLAVSREMKALLQDMRQQHQAVRDFLFNELNVPQGTGGINFIDPRVILEHAPQFLEHPAIPLLNEGYFTSYWKARYASLQHLGPFARLPEKIAVERATLGVEVERLQTTLRDAGYDTNDLIADISHYCGDLGELIAARREMRFQMPHPEFDAAWRADKFKAHETWGRAAVRAKVLADAPSGVDLNSHEAGDQGDLAVLLFNPDKLLDANKYLSLASQYVSAISDAIEEQRAALFEQKDDASIEPDLLRLLMDMAKEGGALPKGFEPVTVSGELVVVDFSEADDVDAD
jgi:hypothetical protein